MRQALPIAALLPGLLLSACGGRASALASDPASPSPSTTESRVVPREFQEACGRPGTTVQLEADQGTVRHADCDLTGVILSREALGVTVPDRGTAASGSGSCAPGATGFCGSVTVETNSQGDVSWSVRP